MKNRNTNLTLMETLLFTWDSRASVIDWKNNFKKITNISEKTKKNCNSEKKKKGNESDLVELDENLNGELGTESTALNHLIQSLRQAHSDRRPPVELERRHYSSSPPLICHKTKTFTIFDENFQRIWRKNHFDSWICEDSTEIARKCWEKKKNEWKL